MKFFSKENPDRLRLAAWWLCVVTMPWLDVVNSISIVFLMLLTITDKGFLARLKALKTSTWAWPFFAYYVLLVAGVFYSPDKIVGASALSQKLTFVVLPVAAIAGRKLNDSAITLLKRSFVYSCTILVFLSLLVATINATMGVSASNFDVSGLANYNSLHPGASPFWMHFSYIQLSHWIDLHPAYFSMYLVFCLVILFNDSYSSGWQIIIHSVIGIAFGAFISLLSSRMAIVAFIFSALYLVVEKIRQHKAASAFPILITASLLIILLWVNPVARFRVVEEPMRATYRADTSVTHWNSVTYRLLEWKGSWAVIRDNLFLGVGTGGWKTAMKKFYAPYNSSTSGVLYNSHNQFLQTWMENGIAALVAFSFCLFGALFRPAIDPTYAAFILIFSLMCLTESIGERQKGIVFFTLFQSLFLGLSNASK